VKTQITKKSKKKSATKKKADAKKKAETILTQIKAKDADDNQEIQTQAEEQIAADEAPAAKVAPVAKAAPVAEPKKAAAPAPKPEAKKAAPKKEIDPLDVVEADPVFKTKEEKIAHQDKVRNEGLKLLMFKPKNAVAQQETELEIEEPGAANSVAEEGAKVIQTEKEFELLKDQLKYAREK